MRLRSAPVLLSLVLAVGAGDAGALGFGTIGVTALLGQPLRLRVPLNLDGEALEPRCVAAEVVAGDTRLTPQQVQVFIEPGADGQQAVARISTAVVMDEPVVNITLSVGCPVRLQRRLVALVDPPTMPTAAVTPSTTPVDAQGVPVAATADAVPPPRATPPSAPPAATANAVPPRAPRRPVTASTGVAASAPGEPASPGPRASAAAAPRTSPPARGNRLQLETAEAPAPSVASAAALLAAQEQAGALLAAQQQARAAEAAASAAAERVRAMEKSLAQLQADAATQREQLAALREARVREQQSLWWPWLLVAVLALGCAWLALRLRRQQQQARWWQGEPAHADGSRTPSSAVGSAALADGAQADPSSPVTTTPGALVTPAVAVPAIVSSAPAAPSRPAPTPLLPVSSPMAAETRRGLSIEEHIDLEQQADFFLVLGQDDAAIDLLLTQLRGTGGTSPMPYLKLMQIYRRLDDEVAYERTRERFEQRFNANAPRWADAQAAQRELDDYPPVLLRLQAVWPQPLDAMAELEALLFRRGGPDERFDLAAYEDLLFLYWLTRELQQPTDGDDGANVDVLLPLSDGPVAPVADPLVPSAGVTPLGVPDSAHMAPKLDALDLVLELELPPQADAPAVVPPAAAPPSEDHSAPGQPSLELVRDDPAAIDPTRPSRR